MRSKLVPTLVSCLVAMTAPNVQAEERSRAGVCALEGLGALGGIVCGTGCGLSALVVGLLVEHPPYIVYYGSSGDPSGAAIFYGLAAVCAAATPAAAAYGTCRAGEALGEQGSRAWAFRGAYWGIPAAAGIAALGVAVGYAADPRSGGASYSSYPFYVLAGLAIPAGAVLGYNLGASRESGPFEPGFGGRLQPPGVALTSVELPDHSVEYGLKVQLAGLRF